MSLVRSRAGAEVGNITGVKMLFDQNLSPRLSRSTADLYPGSLHVREVGMRDANDDTIWSYARENGFVIVSKDSDFQARSLLFGSPPKFLWLRVGNCPAQFIENLLRQHSMSIQAFGMDPIESHLMLP